MLPSHKRPSKAGILPCLRRPRLLRCRLREAEARLTSEQRRLFPTKLRAEWRCSDCDALISVGDRCFRVIDRGRSFPVICATCSGRAPGDAGTRCGGCLEPLRWSQQDDGWEHEDGEPFQWKTVKCERCHGSGHFANGEKCERRVRRLQCQVCSRR